MATSSRSLSRKMRAAKGKKPSQTPGKLKNEACQKSDLKEFGRHANPNKLNAGGRDRYQQYCRVIDGMNPK